MANTPYQNFFLENEVEDQFVSHLNHEQFCTINDSLTGQPGMIYKVNVYTATNGTEDVAQGVGNTKIINASFTPATYTIKTAQNHGQWYDEEQMTDPMVGAVIARHAGVDMFNHVNADILAEFAKGTQSVTLSGTDYFGAFVDAQAMINDEIEDPTFALINPADLAAVRKALKDDLKYVEAYVRRGYVGTVAGTNLYTDNAATAGKIIVATKQAVTVFHKKGVESELYQVGNRSETAANLRQNDLFTRKYYVAALTNDTKVAIIQ